jgi:hypothetical protein
MTPAANRILRVAFDFICFLLVRYRSFFLIVAQGTRLQKACRSLRMGSDRNAAAASPDERGLQRPAAGRGGDTQALVIVETCHPVLLPEGPRVGSLTLFPQSI